MSTSKLQKEVGRELIFSLNRIEVLENKRPDWLISSQGERLELDFYIPELSLAVEVQGKQHYIFVPYFHNERRAFIDQLRRDREKRYLCEKKGVTLLEVSSDGEIDDLIKKVIDMIPQAETDEDFVCQMKKYNEVHPERIDSAKKDEYILTLRKKKLRSRHFKRFKKKVLILVRTIRSLTKRAGNLRKELEYDHSQSDIAAKKRRLVNIIKSREEQISALKSYVKNNPVEIRLAFIFSKEGLPLEHQQWLLNQYLSLR